MTQNPKKKGTDADYPMLKIGWFEKENKRGEFLNLTEYVFRPKYEGLRWIIDSDG